MPWKITPSLYSAWRFYAFPAFDRTEEQEQQARDEFIRVLRKEPSEPTAEMERGNEFEALITRYIDGRGDDPAMKYITDGDRACAALIAEQVRDGVMQVKDGRELPSGNYIYGVADCILLNGIIDFKRVTNYEQDKYAKSIQHWAYMYIWDLPQFYYFVGNGDPQPFIEPYAWFDGAVGLLESRITEMIWWINQDPELREIFAEYWTYNSDCKI